MERVDNFNDLKKVSSISWSVRENADGDCVFAPDKVAVRFDDNAGHYWEIPLYFVLWNEEQCLKQEGWASAFLNLVFASLGITDGLWIGVNCGISEAVNNARKHFPKQAEELERNFRKEEIF